MDKYGNPMFTDLSQEDRKAVEEWISLAPKMFKMCESRLTHYGLGTENVRLVISDIDTTRDFLDLVRKDLIERHKLNRQVQ